MLWIRCSDRELLTDGWYPFKEHKVHNVTIAGRDSWKYSLLLSGLNVHEDSILQIACIVTDGSLKVIKEAGEITIHHGDDVLERMNDWCQQHHGESGLIDAVRESTVTMEEAESRILEFIEKHAEPDSPIAGNSVHVDVQFLRRLMPRITDYCHYRIVDVSTIGELCHRWYPREANSAPRKKNAHTALSDIRESIHQLRYYRSHIFK